MSSSAQKRGFLGRKPCTSPPPSCANIGTKFHLPPAVNSCISMEKRVCRAPYKSTALTRMDQRLRGGKHMIPANTSKEESAAVFGLCSSVLVRGKQEGTKSEQRTGVCRVHISRAAALPQWLLPQMRVASALLHVHPRMAQRILTMSFHSLCNHLFIE